MIVEKVKSISVCEFGGIFDTYEADPAKYSILPNTAGTIRAYGIEVLKEVANVGIIADIHQNSGALEEVLDTFNRKDVNVVLALGDYSFIPPLLGKADPVGIRAVQYEQIVNMLLGWQLKNKHRRVVMMMGNHEVDPTYYENGHNSQTYLKITETVPRLCKNQGIVTPWNPFSSYEMDNCFDVRVYFGFDSYGYSSDRFRLFRLSHAISDTFVTTMYRGLYSPSDPLQRHIQIEKLRTSIGPVWCEAVLEFADRARELWIDFISTETKLERRNELRNIINNNIKNSLCLDSLLDILSNSGSGYADEARRFMLMAREEYKYREEHYKTYTLNDYGLAVFLRQSGHAGSMFVSEEFRKGIIKMCKLLGGAPMYNVCGHFHSDLGIFKSSQTFGSYLIGVSGFQPLKRIALDGTAYIVECSKNSDTIYRLSINVDSNSTNEFSCDLSKKKWDKLLG